jgi:hypothetical protein
MRLPNFNLRFSGIVVFLAASGLALAQQTVPGGWRRANDAPPQAERQQQDPQMDPTMPVDRSDQYGQPQQQADQDAPLQDQIPPDQRNMDQRGMHPSYGLPPQVTVKPNTYITVRTNQPLSSDHNQVGDTFSATLLQPLVAQGVVVAQRGQTVYGRVVVAEKAHSGHDSRLGLELTGVTLADGTQEPIHTQLVAHQGPKTPGGIEAGTVVGTTAVGAAVGGIAARGTGAAIGAGAGAAAGIIGVMLTHNHETRLYPETALTFEVTTPVSVMTANAPQAFRFVGPEDYDRPSMQYNTRPAPRTVVAAPYYSPYPYYGGYYGYGYPYWGPSVVIGGGWGWGGGYYRGGGFYRGGHRR